MNKAEVVCKANIKHQYRYDYSSLPELIKSNDIVQPYCSKEYPWGETHGYFSVYVNHHINRGDGCPKCSGRYKRNKSDFVKEANYIHGGVYRYDNFVFNGMKKKGVIHCTKHNLDFNMSPEKHLLGQGCRKCKNEKISTSKTKSFSDVVECANRIHNGKYKYIQKTYVNGDTNFAIICPEHGLFYQTPNNHTNKHHPTACPMCSETIRAQKRTYSNEVYKQKANKKHNGYYSYDTLVYYSSDKEVEICCPKHGMFKQIARNHLQGQGCPICKRSRLENEIGCFLSENNIKFIEQASKKDLPWLGRQSLDFYLPDHNVAIECQGKQHFVDGCTFGSTKNDECLDIIQKRDKLKSKKCRLNNLKLLYYSNLGIEYPYQVFEDKEKLLGAIYG